MYQNNISTQHLPVGMMVMSGGPSDYKGTVMGSISGAQVGPEHSLQVGADKRGIGAAPHNKSENLSLFSWAEYVAFRKILSLLLNMDLDWDQWFVFGICAMCVWSKNYSEEIRRPQEE